MRCPHPHLERAEGMLDRFAARAHGLRIFIEPLLRNFENVLVLPAFDDALLCFRALRLERAFTAGIRRIMPFLAASLFCWAAIDVLAGQIDKILPAEAGTVLRKGKANDGYGNQREARLQDHKLTGAGADGGSVCPLRHSHRSRRRWRST